MYKKLALIFTFFAGQGAVQLLGVVFGLVAVRFLAAEAYAQFSLALAFQATVATLMDLGYASTIVPLVGERFSNTHVVGTYIAAAKHHRDRIFFLFSPLVAICFFILGHKHHWRWHVQLLLVLSILLHLYFSGRVSYYSVPLILHGQLRKLYGPQVVSAALRCVGPVLLAPIGVLNGWTTALLSTATQVFNSVKLRRASRSYIAEPDTSDPAVNREMMRYVMPAMPAIIFWAFQSQISFYLVTLFGKTTSMAQVAALGRVGQLFSVLTAFNVVLIEPRFARMPREMLPKQYLRVVGLASLFGVLVTLASFHFPFFLLWFLGSQYRDLGPEVGWVVLSNCINYLAGVIWIMNRARKWLFWTGTAMEIGLTVFGEAAFASYRGVATTHDAILVSVIAAVTVLVAHAFIGMYGFMNGPRATETLKTGVGALPA